MPKLSLALASALALLLARGAHAEATLYFELAGGPSFAHDAHVSDHRGPNNAVIRYQHGDDVFDDLGWNANGAVGIHINRSSKHSFRFDLSGAGHRADIKKLVADGITLSRGGHTAIDSAMINGYYEHDFGDLAWFKGFIGAGAGVGFVELERGRSSSTVQIDDDSTEFAFHGTVGVALPLGDHVDLTAAYRYFGTTSPELAARQRDPGTGAFQNGQVDVDVGISDVLFGVRVTF
jgi:opacity protein-like surface antigen